MARTERWKVGIASQPIPDKKQYGMPGVRFDVELYGDHPPDFTSELVPASELERADDFAEQLANMRVERDTVREERDEWEVQARVAIQAETRLRHEAEAERDALADALREIADSRRYANNPLEAEDIAQGALDKLGED